MNEEYIQQLKTMMHSNNASQFLAGAFAQNPRLKSIMALINSGGNGRVIYEQLARQMGYNPNFILNKLLN